MRCWVKVGNNSSHRLRAADIPHIPLRLEVAVQADKRSAEDRVVEVGTERVLAEVEQHVGAVVLHSDVEILRNGGYARF